jgi:ketosteroid isomerase-like protein
VRSNSFPLLAQGNSRERLRVWVLAGDTFEAGRFTIVKTRCTTATLTDDFLSEFFDPAVEWVPIPQGVLVGTRYVGFEGIRRFSTDFVAAWDELVVEPQEFQEAGEVVVARIQMRGRMRALEIDEVWSALYTFRTGRIVRVEGFSSPDGAIEAAGLRK